MKSSSDVSKSLKTACQFLNIQENEQVLKEAELVCEHLANSFFSIAIFAPFNYGKSTLINALLGKEIMPTKMVRTTGVIISIKYGKTLKTYITLKSGEVIRKNDTEILKEFAVLNRKGKRREDVLSVEVFYPHRLLKNGVELFDLPGTNDREEQDQLVRNKLLQVDLVIQILNAGQPFTLGEQEKLRHWLYDREIKTIIFVLNRMNQIESKEDQNEILNDVISTTQPFLYHLPQGLEGLYQVDALPAIQTKQNLKNWKANNQGFSFYITKIKKFIDEYLILIKTGILNLEAALSIFVYIQKKRIYQTRLPRVIAIATQLQSILQKKADYLEGEIEKAENDRKAVIKKGKERELFLKQEFKRRIETYQNWLLLDNLVRNYQTEAAQALEDGQFKKWQNHEFKPNIVTYIKTIEEWTNQSCDEFQKNRPNQIHISFPNSPNVFLPRRKDRDAVEWVSDLFNGEANRIRLNREYERKKWQAYKDAVYRYLANFSKETLSSLKQYERNVESLIRFPIPPESARVIQKRHQLEKLNSSIDVLQNLELLKSKIDTHKLNRWQRFQMLLLFWKNWLFLLFQ
jgi:hypothetical protein